MATNSGVRITGLLGGGVAALAVAGLAVIFSSGAGAGPAPAAAIDQGTQATTQVVSQDAAPVDSSQSPQNQPAASADPGVIYVYGPPQGGEHEHDSNQNGDD